MWRARVGCHRRSQGGVHLLVMRSARASAQPPPQRMAGKEAPHHPSGEFHQRSHRCQVPNREARVVPFVGSGEHLPNARSGACGGHRAGVVTGCPAGATAAAAGSVPSAGAVGQARRTRCPLSERRGQLDARRRRASSTATAASGGVRLAWATVGHGHSRARRQYRCAVSGEGGVKEGGQTARAGWAARRTVGGTYRPGGGGEPNGCQTCRRARLVVRSSSSLGCVKGSQSAGLRRLHVMRRVRSHAARPFGRNRPHRRRHRHGTDRCTRRCRQRVGSCSISAGLRPLGAAVVGATNHSCCCGRSRTLRRC